jgi:hypothetical protein
MSLELAIIYCMFLQKNEAREEKAELVDLVREFLRGSSNAASGPPAGSGAAAASSTLSKFPTAVKSIDEWYIAHSFSNR